MSMSGVIIAIGLAKWHHEFKWVPALLCLAFALLPLVQTALPVEDLDRLVNASALAPLFNSDHLILAIMNGRL